jgi:hypothetical protein
VLLVAVALLGISLIVAGVALITIPGGFITAGILVVAVAVTSAYVEARTPEAPAE